MVPVRMFYELLKLWILSTNGMNALVGHTSDEGGCKLGEVGEEMKKLDAGN